MFYPRSNARKYSAAALAASCCLALSSLRAQTATDSGAVPNAKDNAIVLSPFEVSTSQDNGYVAQNTAIGSRLNTNLRDTPAPITVFTSQFIRDIAATDIADVAAYAVNTITVPGFQSGTAQGDNVAEYDTQFRIRGLPAASDLGRSVDFFPYPIEVDTFDTDRVEFGRGPNSILFGIGASGGNFNVSSKRANINTSFEDATFRADSEGGLRGTIDVDQPVIQGKVGIRINAIEQDLNSWRPFEHNDATRAAIAGRYKIDSRTTLDVSVDLGHVNEASDRPWVGIDSISDWINDGRQTVATLNGAIPANSAIARQSGVHDVVNTTTGALANWQNQTYSAPTSHFGTATVPGNQILLIQNFALVPKATVIAGPGYQAVEDYQTYSAFLEHEFTPNLFIELAVNKQNTTYRNADPVAANLNIYYDTNQLLPDGTPNPNVGKPYLEGQWTKLYRTEDSDNSRATISYKLDLGKIFGVHQLAGLVEYREQSIVRNLQTLRQAGSPATPGTPEAVANGIYYRTYVNLTGPVKDIAMAAPDPITQHLPINSVYFTNGAQANYNYLFGFTSYMAATQSSFWNDRLVATLGARNDAARSYYSTAQRGTPQDGYTVGFYQAVRSTTPTKLSGNTESLGAVFKITNWLSATYDKSSNFLLPNAQIVIFPNLPPQPTHGRSQDYGFKFDLLHGKLYATITRYTTAAKNDADFTNDGPAGDLVSIWNTLYNAGVAPPNGLTQTQQTAPLAAGGNNFDSNSQGYEFEMVANLSHNWRAFLNAAQNETVQTNINPAYLTYLNQYASFFTQGTNGRLVLNGTAGQLAANPTGNTGITTITDEVNLAYAAANAAILAPDGLLRMSIPKYSGNLRTSYDFTEAAVRGVTVGLGARWQGPSVIGYTADTQPKEIWGHNNVLVDADIGYRRKVRLMGRVFDWSLQLNVKNVLNNTNIIITGAFTDGAPRQYVVQPPSQYILTSTFHF